MVVGNYYHAQNNSKWTTVEKSLSQHLAKSETVLRRSVPKTTVKKHLDSRCTILFTTTCKPLVVLKENLARLDTKLWKGPDHMMETALWHVAASVQWGVLTAVGWILMCILCTDSGKCCKIFTSAVSKQHKSIIHELTTLSDNLIRTAPAFC